MRKLTIIEHITLDGVMQHSADGGDFPYPEWNTPYRTPAGRDMMLALHGERFDLLLGRRTYDQWSGFWPKAPASPFTERLNAATKHVVTHRPEGLTWGPSAWVGPDLVAGVRRIKESAGPDVIVSGSSTLVTPLLAAGLADELVLAIYPLVLGVGKRFVAPGNLGVKLELISTATTATGVVVQAYRVAGPVKGA